MLLLAACHAGRWRSDHGIAPTTTAFSMSGVCVGWSRRPSQRQKSLLRACTCCHQRTATALDNATAPSWRQSRGACWCWQVLLLFVSKSAPSSACSGGMYFEVFALTEIGRRPESIGVEISKYMPLEYRKVTSAPSYIQVTWYQYLPTSLFLLAATL